MVVNAGGMYGAELGRMAGVRVPLIPMSHQYLVTQPFREHSDEQRLPTLRDPDLLVYYREDGGGLVMGGYERESEPAFLPGGTGRFDQIPPAASVAYADAISSGDTAGVPSTIAGTTSKFVRMPSRCAIDAIRHGPRSSASCA